MDTMAAMGTMGTVPVRPKVSGFIPGSPETKYFKSMIPIYLMGIAILMNGLMTVVTMMYVPEEQTTPEEIETTKDTITMGFGISSFLIILLMLGVGWNSSFGKIFNQKVGSFMNILFSFLGLQLITVIMSIVLFVGAIPDASKNLFKLINYLAIALVCASYTFLMFGMINDYNPV